MISLIGDDLESYVHDHTTPEPPLLKRLRCETFEGLEDPEMQVGRVEGAFLRLMVQISGAKRILELGCFSGYSALAMASALPEEGSLITCDKDPAASAMAQRHFDQSPYGHRIQLRLGPAIETLAQLKTEAAVFDLAFIDADKESYVDYWEAILPLIEPGGIILADNTLWDGKVLDPQETSDHGIVAFNAHVRADDRVEQVLLPVRDGITLSRKL